MAIIFAVDTNTVGSTSYVAVETSDAPVFADDIRIIGVTVSVTAGDLGLLAGDDILLDSILDVDTPLVAQATASGNVTVRAGVGDLDGGGFIISEGLIQAGVAGNVDIDAIGNIQPGRVIAGALASLTSTAGAIIDNNAIGADITAAALALIAATGIGTLADPLDTQVGSLEATTATGGIFLSNTATNLMIGGADDAEVGIKATTSGNISLFNTGNIILAGASNEDIRAASGNVRVEATGDVEVRNNSVDAIDSDNGDVTIIAGRDILLCSAATDAIGDVDANGNVILSATRDVIVDEGTFVDAFLAGTITVTAGRNISILASDGTSGARLSTAGGDITLTTGADGLLTVDSNSASGTIKTTQLGGNGSIVIHADRVNITPNDTVEAGTGIVAIAPVSAGWAIDLGSATDVASTTLELSDAELDRITASAIVIGNSLSGNISVTAAITLPLSSPLLLRTGGAIVDNNTTGADISAAALSLAAANGIGTLADPLETQVGNLEAVAAAGGIFLSNTATNLLIGFVDAAVNGIQAASGDISLFNDGNILLAGAAGEDIRAASGNVTVQATGNVEVHNGSVSAIDSDSGNVTIIAGQDILLGSTVTDNIGDVEANGNLILSAGLDIIVNENTFVDALGAGTLTVTAGRDISILASDGTANARFSTQGGDITLTTGANGILTVDSDNGGGAINTTLLGGNGNITINADQAIITAGDTVRAGTGVVTLREASAGRLIDLGSTTDAAIDTLELSDAELDQIFGGLLRIGSATSGAINISDTIDLANIATLSLQSGGFIGGARIEETNLALRAGGVGLAVDVDTLAGQSTADDGQFVVIDNLAGLTIGTVDGVSGVSTNNGLISVQAPNLTVSAPVNAGTDFALLRAFAFGALLTNQSSISGGDVTRLTADAIDLQPGSSVTATGTVILDASTLGVSADVGSAGPGLAFSQAELDTVTAPVLQITGALNVNVSQNVAFDPAKVPAVFLQAFSAAGAIIDATATETAQITATGLALSAGAGIGAADDLDIAVSTLAFDNVSGAVNITNSGPLVLGAVAGLASSTNFGSSTTITATSPLTVAANLISGGIATLTATDSAATGDNLTINAGAAVQSISSSLVLQAGDDFNLAAGATLVAGGAILIQLDFGNADAGVGGTAILNGFVGAPFVQISGGSDNDTVTTALSVLAGMTINGLDGNDRIGGGGGDDALNGGAGIDTAVFHGSRADYLIEPLGGDTVRVTDLRPGAPDGIDLLHSIENLAFKEPVTDFNGDGVSDILWQNDNGQPGIWLMDGLATITDGVVGFNPGAPWNAKGAGDFNADGHADILWQNDDGTAGIWLMDGLTRLDGANVGFNPGPAWTVIDAGDFNADGKADILWQNDNGQAGIWLMDGFSVIADGGVGFNPGPTWDVKASGDFNGDGHADILWQNDNGTAGVWLMDGLTVLADSGLAGNPGASWNVIDAGDFNGDGKADILWQNDNGQAAIWLMDGFTQLAGANVGFNPGPTWHVKAAADTNGDGHSDILWQNDNGQAGVWLMDGLTVLADSGVGFNPGPTWHVVGQNHELA